MRTADVRPDPRIQALPVRGDPASVRRVLRRARPHGGSKRQPRAGRRSDAAVHELGDGPVQGRPDRRGDTVTTRGQSTTSASCAWPASTTTSRKSAGRHGTHLLRDARQLELRRLLQARGDPLGLGLPDARPGHPGRPSRGHDVHGRRGRVVDLARRDRPAARADGPLGRRRQRRRQQLLADGRDRPVRPVQRDPLRPRRSTCPRVPSASRTTPSTARAGSRSGTSCSWSSTSGRTAGIRCRSRASTPGWVSSVSRASSSRSRRTTTPTCSLPIHERMRELLGHDPDDFESRAVQLPGHRRPLAGGRPSSSPMACCRRTRAAATSSAGSCGAPCATAGSSAGASRSWPRLGAVVVDDHGRGVSTPR